MTLNAYADAIYAEMPRGAENHSKLGNLYTEVQMRLFADDTHALRTQAQPMVYDLRAATPDDN